MPRQSLTIACIGCHGISRAEVQPDNPRRLDCSSWRGWRSRTSWFAPLLVAVFVSPQWCLSCSMSCRPSSRPPLHLALPLHLVAFLSRRPFVSSSLCLVAPSSCCPFVSSPLRLASPFVSPPSVSSPCCVALSAPPLLRLPLNAPPPSHRLPFIWCCRVTSSESSPSLHCPPLVWCSHGGHSALRVAQTMCGSAYQYQASKNQTWSCQCQ